MSDTLFGKLCIYIGKVGTFKINVLFLETVCSCWDFCEASLEDDSFFHSTEQLQLVLRNDHLNKPGNK